MKKTMLLVMLALTLVFAFTATALADDPTVTIYEPMKNATGTFFELSEDSKAIAVKNGAGSVYFTVTGLTEEMTVSGTKVVSDSQLNVATEIASQLKVATEIAMREVATNKDGLYKVDYKATDKKVGLTVKGADGAAIESVEYTLARPSLSYIRMNEKESTTGADKVEDFSDKNIAIYTVDDEWDTLYIQPVATTAYATITIDGEELEGDDWFKQSMKKDEFEYEIEVTVEFGADKYSETYTLYAITSEYEEAELTSFTAGVKKDTDAFLTFIGEKKLYVFVPYDYDDEDEYYFQALTGDKNDTVTYTYDGDSDEEEEYAGNATKSYYVSESLDKITVEVEDKYGITSEYEVVTVVATKNAGDDADLDDLVIKTGKKSSSIKTEAEILPEFEYNVTSYSVLVEDGQKYATFTMKPSDKDASIFVNGEFIGQGNKSYTATVELPEETGKFIITVVAEDGETYKNYTLNINGGDSTQLKSMAVTGLTKSLNPAFAATQLNYLGYTSASSVTINAVAESAACSVTISGSGSKNGLGSANGTFNLAEGLNVFNVTCYQKGLTANIYTVSIYRIPAEKTIKVSKQAVTVNGVAKTLTAYNINGNNFLQLRDVALLLNGTNKGFAVDFNDNTQTANLTSGAVYIPNGTENAAISTYKYAAVSTQNFNLNNKAVYPAAFNIDGSNYVMLRDLGILLNFGITFSDNTIAINTSNVYIPGK